MMSANEITQSVLRFLEMITQWSVIVLIIVLLLRRQLIEFLPALIRRIRKASVGGASVEFASEAITAFAETVEKGIDQRREQPDEAMDFIKEQLDKLVQAAPQEKPSKPLEGRSILWVDDTPANNAYETNYLKNLGASITPVLSTINAEAEVKRSSFNLIISDVARTEEGKVNRRAGYDLLTLLQDIRPQMPVVLYTKNAHRKLRVPEVVAYGAYVADTSSDLVNTVVHLIGR
jgi:CheY-like chemotaxis protein